MSKNVDELVLEMFFLFFWRYLMCLQSSRKNLALTRLSLIELSISIKKLPAFPKREEMRSWATNSLHSFHQLHFFKLNDQDRLQIYLSP